MTNYINGAIRESIERAKMLISKIPGAKDLGLYFSPLARAATTDIQNIINSLDYLYNDVDYSDASNLRQKFFKFKKLSGNLAEIENVVIAAMSRITPDDEFVNKLVYEICSEISYPLPSPVASCLSQKYYHIYAEYGLLCIPLLESDFVLHIPDVYHELGHPLIELDNPKVEPFKKSLGQFNAIVRKHFDDEIKRRNLNKSVPGEFDPLLVYKSTWLEHWSIEIFCDLFATYTLGPAYAWSNIHMCAKMSWDTYRLPTFQKISHPPNEARMKAIILGLNIIGCKSDAEAIQKKWDEFKHIVGQRKGPDFSIAVPEKLLKDAADLCLIGTRNIGSEIYNVTNQNKVNLLLNNSWKAFWKDPEAFADGEAEMFRNFKASF